MDTVPKNKRYTIKRLLEIDPSLSIDDLKTKNILELTKMIEDTKVKSIQKVAEFKYEPRSLWSYFGGN
jgi:hypothetical protein